MTTKTALVMAPMAATATVSVILAGHTLTGWLLGVVGVAGSAIAMESISQEHSE